MLVFGLAAYDGLNQSPACNACRMIPRLSRRHRGEHFQVKFGPQVEVEDQDLEVVEMDEQDDEVPFEFTLPRGRVTAFTEEEDDEDASLSGTFGSGGQEGSAHRSAHLEFPAVKHFNLLSPRDPGTGALPQHLAGNSV